MSTNSDAGAGNQVVKLDTLFFTRAEKQGGARIVGDGTQSRPFTIQLTPVQAAAPALLSALKDVLSSLEVPTDNSAQTVDGPAHGPSDEVMSAADRARRCASSVVPPVQGDSPDSVAFQALLAACQAWLARYGNDFRFLEIGANVSLLNKTYIAVGMAEAAGKLTSGEVEP